MKFSLYQTRGLGAWTGDLVWARDGSCLVMTSSPVPGAVSLTIPHRSLPLHIAIVRSPDFVAKVNPVPFDISYLVPVDAFCSDEDFTLKTLSFNTNFVLGVMLL